MVVAVVYITMVVVVDVALDMCLFACATYTNTEVFCQFQTECRIVRMKECIRDPTINEGREERETVLMAVAVYARELAMKWKRRNETRKTKKRDMCS